MLRNYKRLLFYPLLILVLPALISCQAYRVEFSDSMSRPAMNDLNKNLDQDKVDYNPEFYDLLGKSAVIFSALAVSVSKENSKEMFAAINDNLVKKIRGFGLYEKTLTMERADDILRSQGSFKNLQEMYMDSLTAVSVSDKDIANPLGKLLESDNLLVFQLDHLPPAVPEVKEADRYIRMKLRLVDAESGHIIWTGVAETLGLSDDELKELTPVGLAVSDTLIDGFLNIFKRKWHKKMFDNLGKL